MLEFAKRRRVESLARFPRQVAQQIDLIDRFQPVEGHRAEREGRPGGDGALDLQRRCRRVGQARAPLEFGIGEARLVKLGHRSDLGGGDRGRQRLIADRRAQRRRVERRGRNRARPLDHQVVPGQGVGLPRLGGNRDQGSPRLGFLDRHPGAGRVVAARAQDLQQRRHIAFGPPPQKGEARRSRVALPVGGQRLLDKAGDFVRGRSFQHDLVGHRRLGPFEDSRQKPVAIARTAPDHRRQQNTNGPGQRAVWPIRI